MQAVQAYMQFTYLACNFKHCMQCIFQTVSFCYAYLLIVSNIYMQVHSMYIHCTVTMYMHAILEIFHACKCLCMKIYYMENFILLIWDQRRNIIIFAYMEVSFFIWCTNVFTISLVLKVLQRRYKNSKVIGSLEHKLLSLFLR